MKYLSLAKCILFIAFVILLISQNSCIKEDEKNTPPSASFTIEPTEGSLTTVFTFNADSCSDKEDNRTLLQIRWDWDNNGLWETDWSSNKIIQHQFETIGDHNVVMEVKDSKGLSNSTSHNVTIYQGDLPLVTTSDISNITQNSAISGGTVITQDTSVIIARGVCWDTVQYPTIANSYTSNGDGPGEFTSLINGLRPETIYYVRAYSTNSFGTAYGSQKSFTTIGDNLIPINEMHWVIANGPANVFIEQIKYFNSTIYIGHFKGLSISRDDGMTWSEVEGMHRVYDFLEQENSLYVCDSGGVKITSDFGQTWDDCTIPLYGTRLITKTSDRIFVKGAVSFDEQAIFYSDFNCTSWFHTASGQNVTDYNNHYMCSIGDNVFAAFGETDICQYDYALNHWKLISSMRLNGLESINNKLFALTENGVLISENFGNSWYEANNGLTNLQTTEITFKNNIVIVGTNGGGVFLSKDFGLSWTAINEGLQDLVVRNMAFITNYILMKDSDGHYWKCEIFRN